MTQKARKIMNWALTGLVGLIFIGSALVKLSGSENAAEMAEGIGLSTSALTAVGIVELIAVVLFIIPRTGILGILLLAAYMGGAMATHIVLGEPFIFPAIIQALVWVVAALRFPELTQRFIGKNKQSGKTANAA